MASNTAADGASNFGSGLGHGVLALVGLGDLYNPLGDAENQLSQATQDMNTMVGKMSSLVVTNIVNTDFKIEQWVTDSHDSLQATANFNDEILKQAIVENSLFIGITAAAVLILIFFTMLHKDCC
jgi:hypothetical protein